MAANPELPAIALVAAAFAILSVACAQKDPPGVSGPEAGEPAASATAALEAGEPAPAPAAAPTVSPSAATATLVVISNQAQVYAGPNARERRIAYVRRGSKLSAEPRPVTGEGCSEGWYRLAPYGFVCGRNVSADANHPEARARNHASAKALDRPAPRSRPR